MGKIFPEVKIRANQAPQRFILIIVCIVSLVLLGSAFYTLNTLSRLREQYLGNRGHEIAVAIESQARGQGRRNNPQVWQSLFESNYEFYSGSVAFFELVDQNGNRLAGKGDLVLGSPEPSKNNYEGIYKFEEQLSPPRNPNESHAAVAGWRLRIGLYLTDTNFINRLGIFQLGASGLAVLMMLLLAIFLMRMLHRFIEVKAREGEEAHLKALGVMAASLAHEIRNPLGAMKGLTQLAQEDLMPNDVAQGRLKTVVSEAERLERLVADLLDFARPKSPQFQTVDLGKVVQDVVEMLKPKLVPQGLCFEISMNPKEINIRSDPGGIRQVLINVILNAIDASPAGGTVSIHVIPNATPDMIAIEIDDAGPGLENRDPSELFQPFVTTKTQGTGLGLAVSRQIIERLGGSLLLSDNPKGGARCSILIPQSRS